MGSKMINNHHQYYAVAVVMLMIASRKERSCLESSRQQFNAKQSTSNDLSELSSWCIKISADSTCIFSPHMGDRCLHLPIFPLTNLSLNMVPSSVDMSSMLQSFRVGLIIHVVRMVINANCIICHQHSSQRHTLVAPRPSPRFQVHFVPGFKAGSTYVSLDFRNFFLLYAHFKEFCNS